MADRFIAINVGLGDAFFLERGDFSALKMVASPPGFPAAS